MIIRNRTTIFLLTDLLNIANKFSLDSSLILSITKPNLAEVLDVAHSNSALGVNVAHSGTVIGILFAADKQENWQKCCQEILQINKEFSYLGVVDLVNGGIE